MDAGSAASLAEKEEVNTGQDITKPLTRVDFRLSDQVTASEHNSSTFILRSDKPIVLGDGWTLALRADAPVIYSNVPSSSNPSGWD